MQFSLYVQMLDPPLRVQRGPSLIRLSSYQPTPRLEVEAGGKQTAMLPPSLSQGPSADAGEGDSKPLPLQGPLALLLPAGPRSQLPEP